MTDRIPGAPGRCKAVITGQELQKLQAGEEFAITLRRDDQPIKEGTPYSKAAVLPDALAASLCPGMVDPAPRDAFAALHTQKADTVRRAAGKALTLRDAARTPLMGLKIYGSDTEESGVVGEKGNITVTVTGKNMIDYRKAYARNSTQTVTVDENMNGLYWTGDYHFYIPVSIPAGTTVCFNCESESEDGNYINSLYVNYSDGTEQYFDISECITPQKDVVAMSVKSCYADVADMRVWNIQVEIGTVVTEYEPYREAQTLTISTPNGLPAIGEYRDEIDFARGVYVQRIKTLVFDGSENWINDPGCFALELTQFANDSDNFGICNHYSTIQVGYDLLQITDTVNFPDLDVTAFQQFLADKHAEGNPVTAQYVLAEPIETALAEEQLEAYAKLRTYVPTTVLTNDAGADMEVIYYTPTTAVQMVHGTANKGKTFTVDDHGCVTLTRDNPVIACGETTVDEVAWYYRKWADGFAECWCNFNGEYTLVDEDDGRVVAWLHIPIPFYINEESWTANLTFPCKQPTIMDMGLEGSEIWLISEGVQQNDTAARCMIYLTGYWKQPEGDAQ